MHLSNLELDEIKPKTNQNGHFDCEQNLTLWFSVWVIKIHVNVWLEEDETEYIGQIWQHYFVPDFGLVEIPEHLDQNLDTLPRKDRCVIKPIQNMQD